MRVRLSHVITASLLTGCALATGGSGDGATPRTVTASVQQAAHAAQAALRQYDIPVREFRPTDGLVQSGTFEVERFWAGEPVRTRVDCGASEVDRQRLAYEPITLNVDVQVLPGGPVPGVQTREARSVVQLRSTGQLGPTGPRCRLSREFAGRILDSIEAMAGRGPGGIVNDLLSRGR